MKKARVIEITTIKKQRVPEIKKKKNQLMGLGAQSREDRTHYKNNFNTNAQALKNQEL